jgi:hypothetical protein
MNPSTYAWEREIASTVLRVTIQQIRKPILTAVAGHLKPGHSIEYILQISKGPKTASELSIDSSENAVYREPLTNLFMAIKEAAYNQGLELYKKLLE